MIVGLRKFCGKLEIQAFNLIYTVCCIQWILSSPSFIREFLAKWFERLDKVGHLSNPYNILIMGLQSDSSLATMSYDKHNQIAS